MLIIFRLKGRWIAKGCSATGGCTVVNFWFIVYIDFPSIAGLPSQKH